MDTGQRFCVPIMKCSRATSGFMGQGVQRVWWPQLERGPLRPPCLSSFNTEHAEPLSDLCVEALLTMEDTEKRKTCCVDLAANAA